MAKKDRKESADGTTRLEGIVTETYPYKDDGATRVAIDAAEGESLRLEAFVPIEFGDTLKMGDKVSITIEKV
jgi:hypothetical protein